MFIQWLPSVDKVFAENSNKPHGNGIIDWKYLTNNLYLLLGVEVVTLGLRVGCGQTSRNESEVISHEICSLNEEVDQNLKARGENVVLLMAQKPTQLNII